MDSLAALLDIAEVKVLETEVIGDEVHIHVESTQTGTRCRRCGRQLTKPCGHGRERVLRHLPVFGRRTFIHIRPLRVECPHCRESPTTTQRVCWYDPRSPHTRAYDDYLLLQLRNSTVADVELKEAVGYEAIMGVLERRIAMRVDWSGLKHLPVVGVDEVALKKGHRDYVVIVTARLGEQSVLLAVLENREKATVKAFFSSIPKRLRKQLRVVCTDMYEGFINAAKEVFSKQAKVVIDRFHVAKLYRGGVDGLRNSELRRLKKQLPEAEYKRLKGAMWALRRSLQNRTEEDARLLRRLFKHSPLLEAAYYASGILTDIFNRASSKRSARYQIRRWIGLVKGSGLNCFDRFLKTLDKWMEEILNYFVDRHTSGFVEGLNNRIKVIKRRCYGIFNVGHLFQRIFLDLGNYHELQEEAILSS